MPVTVTHHAAVAEPEAVLALAERVARADGDPPFSDQTLLDVRAARPTVNCVLATDDGQLVGAAVLAAQPDGTTSVELAVVPERRGEGVGRALAREVRAGVSGTVQAWAHGDHPGARLLAREHRMENVRELYRLKRPLAGAQDLPLPVDLAPGLSIRAFEVGRDENGWLRANSRAFAEHPEQGRITLEDLRQREAEPWFDAAGFLLAVRDEDPEDVQGFHWTKIHPADGDSPALGEVYAVGVCPEQQGRGLGRALTAAGINYLAERGLDEVMLYVDGDNTAAVALYEKLGFERWHVDVMYRGTSTA